MVKYFTLSVLLIQTVIFAKLNFSVTTDTYGGMFSPNHVCAIWLTDGDNNFIKTFEVNANIREMHLRKWSSISGKNKVDALTSATLNSHQKHSISSDTVLEDGDYKVWIEIVENNTSTNQSSWGGNASFEFTISGSNIISLKPSNVEFKNVNIFNDISLTYINDNSPIGKKPSINNNKIVFQQKGGVISVLEIKPKELSIYNHVGKKLLVSKESKINISNLSNGSYIMKVKTETQFFVRRFEVE